MKIHGKGGLLDFSKDKLTERNKENSFLDVDWIIEELINYGHEKMTNSVPKSPNNTLQRSASIKSKFKKKVRFLFFRTNHEWKENSEVRHYLSFRHRKLLGQVSREEGPVSFGKTFSHLIDVL